MGDTLWPSSSFALLRLEMFVPEDLLREWTLEDIFPVDKNMGESKKSTVG